MPVEFHLTYRFWLSIAVIDSLVEGINSSWREYRTISI